MKSLNLKYLDKSDLICSKINKTCSIFDKSQNEFFIIDDHHWTLKGAKFFGGKINFDELFK